MCYECGMEPCTSMCPGAREAEAVYVCSDCGEFIRVGEEFVNTGDSYFHLDCLRALPFYDLIEAFGCVIEEARGDD